MEGKVSNMKIPVKFTAHGRFCLTVDIDKQLIIFPNYSSQEGGCRYSNNCPGCAYGVNWLCFGIAVFIPSK